LLWSILLSCFSLHAKCGQDIALRFFVPWLWRWWQSPWPKRLPAGIVFTHESIFGVFAPHGRHVAPIKVKFGRKERTVLSAIFHLDRLRGEFTAPKTLKKIRILPILLPQRGGSLARFLQNLQVRSLHKSAKFGSFGSINNKIGGVCLFVSPVRAYI